MTEQPMPEMPAERPPVDTKAVFREQIPIVLAELAAAGVMLGIYALLGKLTLTVCLGAALGTGVALLNYVVMIFSLLRAEKAETPAKGQLMVRAMYMVRMVVLLVALILALKSGYFDPLAALLPLALMRIAIFIAELILKKKQKGGK